MKLLSVCLLFQVASSQVFEVDILNNFHKVGSVRTVTVDNTQSFAYMAGGTATSDQGFVSKCLLNGTIVWTQTISYARIQLDKVVVNEQTGEIFALGRVTPSSVDMIVVKYHSNGTQLFVKIFGTASSDWVNDALVDLDNQVLVFAGTYNYNYGVLLADLNNGTLTVYATLAYGEVFGIAASPISGAYFTIGQLYGQAVAMILCLVTPTNSAQQITTINSWPNTNGTASGADIQWDADTQQLFITGTTNNSPYVDFSNCQGFLICATANGTILWRRDFAGDSKNQPKAVLIHGPTRMIYVLGTAVQLPDLATRGSTWVFDMNGNLAVTRIDMVNAVYDEAVLVKKTGWGIMAGQGKLLALNISWSPVTSSMLPSTTTLNVLTSIPGLVATTTNVPVTATVTATFTAPTSSLSVDMDTEVTLSSTSSSTSLTDNSLDTPTPTIEDTTFVASLPAIGAQIVIKYLIIALASVILFLVLVTVACVYAGRARKARRQNLGMYLQTANSDTIFPMTTYEASSYSSSQGGDAKTFSLTEATGMGRTSMGNTTMIGSEFELSLPGYCNFRLKESVELGQVIAKGGGGTLYLARSLNVDLAEKNRHVAVKMINSATSLAELSEPERHVFYQEVSLMHYFRENVHFAKLLGWTDSPPCLIMKFYQHGSLLQWIYGGESLKTRRMQTQFMADISRGVRSMHDAGFVHCDLKPANILLDTDNDGRMFCVLTDFGISQVVNENSMLVKQFQVVNMNGMSPAYAAPEVLKWFKTQSGEQTKGNVAMKKDIYAIAIVAWEILTRRVPYSLNSRKNR